MSNIFQNLQLAAFKKGINPQTDESREWFRKKAANLRSIKPKEIMKEDPIKTAASANVIGNMYMFTYSPKYKDDRNVLPYFDAFPLIISIGPKPGKDAGFLGLNLHYLPPILRAKFLDALMDVTTNNKFDSRTRFKITYEMLQRTSEMKYYKPCLKHYLNKQVTSNFAKVPSKEWEIAVFLPMAKWRYASSQKVYADSRKML